MNINWKRVRSSLAKGLLTLLVINLALFVKVLFENDFGVGEAFTAGWQHGLFTFNGESIGLPLFKWRGLAYLLLFSGAWYLHAARRAGGPGEGATTLA